MLPAINPAVIFKETSDGAVLLDPKAETYFGLNDVGTKVWKSLASAGSSLDSLCTALSAQYPDVPEATIRQDIVELLESLVQNGLAILPVATEHDRDADPTRTP